jgi:protein-L-isoaspartate O-methyltransferase
MGPSRVARRLPRRRPGRVHPTNRLDDPDGGRWEPVDRATNPDRWLELVYADDALTTQVDDGRPADDGLGWLATSSCSMPSMVVTMLTALDVHEGDTVLEIGTGTGWNAALLCHRLGDERVTTVEVDPAVAAEAGARLGRAGYFPLVVTGDGADGYPPAAPFDRVIATCAVATIPYPWIRQTRPDGVIVTPWGNTFGNGALLRLVVAEDGQSASGRVIGPAAFMWLRAQRPVNGFLSEYVGEDDHPDVSATTVDPRAIYDDEDAGFSVGLRVDCQQRLFFADDDSGEYTFWALDGRGSWASVDYEPGAAEYRVEQFGPRRLWDEVEAAYGWWVDAGKPARDRFGVTVTPDGQHVWLDAPNGS